MDNRNDPVAGMAKIMAKLFAFMAWEVIEQCGDQRGGEIVEAAVQKFGEHRGNLRKEATLAAGKSLTLENFEEFSDLPANDAWDCDTVIEGNRLVEDNRYCPFADAWRELGKEAVGSLYCGVDKAMLEGYFGEVQFERPALFTDGPDAPCAMIVNVPKGP